MIKNNWTAIAAPKMPDRRSLVRQVLGVTVLMLAGVVGAGAAPAAADATAGACSLYAERPEYNGSINGWGSWAGCAANAKVTVVLREDRMWWPDRTLDSKTGTGSWGSLLMLQACGNHFDPIKVFVETRSSGKKVQSPRAVLPCA